MVRDLFDELANEDKETILDAYKTTKEQLGLEWPAYEKTDARHKFITIAVALDKYLQQAESEAREQKNV
jgi:hypothetical protein